MAEVLATFGADASAYYYKPGKRFGAYGAEQIACQAESGVVAVTGALRSIPMNVPYPPNDLGLALPHWEVSGPGVVTTC
jgi:hypothetical protein